VVNIAKRIELILSASAAAWVDAFVMDMAFPVSLNE
jgi:hypothetical protein